MKKMERVSGGGGGGGGSVVVPLWFVALFSGALLTIACAAPTASPFTTTSASTRAGTGTPCSAKAAGQQLVCLCGLDEGTQTCEDGELTECNCNASTSTSTKGGNNNATASAASSKSNGSDCTDDVECGLREICKNGRCVDGCFDDRRCGSNEICQNNTCVTTKTGTTTTPPVCNDNNCAFGEICSSYTSTGTCISGCHGTVDCPLKQICVAGQCEPDSKSGSSSSSSSSSSSGSSDGG